MAPRDSKLEVSSTRDGGRQSFGREREQGSATHGVVDDEDVVVPGAGKYQPGPGPVVGALEPVLHGVDAHRD